MLRTTLLKKLRHSNNLRRVSNKPLPIRNIGIIAHVDAGKTTVTERLLYLSGAISVAGNVDKGTTVTDFLDIERERGITVQSAAVNLDWKNHRINLIDTPGHVDFRVEVERCVRVLDGIVCVIDGSAGVQPQTLTVWGQSSKFKLPAIFFINKLDKKEANYEKAVDSIEQKLGIKAIRTTIPFDGKNENFTGIIDTIEQKVLKIGDVNNEWENIVKGTREYDILMEARSEMCYSIADNHDGFLKVFLDEFGGDHTKIENLKLLEVLRELTCRGDKVATVSCGSAIKSLHCVKPILDNVVELFPSPDMRNTELPHIFADDLSGLVFKIVHDKRRGQMSYVRVYTGKLKNNTSVYNSNRMASEGPIKVFTPYADELKPTEFICPGNIAVVSGLDNTVTGDTILSSHASGENAFEKLKNVKSNTNLVQGRTSTEGSTVVFAGIEAPEAVYFCCIEPPSFKQQHAFNRALDELTREDPSMKIRFDKDTGQTIVETQGELHLEAIKDRLLRGYGLNVFIGQLQVAYKEMLIGEVSHTRRIEDVGSEKKRNEFASVTLKIKPIDGNLPFKRVELDLPQTTRSVRPDWHRAINEGCANALQNGPLASFPVQAVQITLTDLVVSGGKVNPALLSACAQKCVSEALENAEMMLTEPVMEVEIKIRSDEPTQPIINELIKRRARIQFSDRINDSTVQIISLLPLAEMENLSRVVRTLTSGFGDMHVQISGYQEVPEFERNAILKRKSAY